MEDSESLGDLLDLLNRAVGKPSERMAAISAFQRRVFETATPIQGAEEEQWRILHDLAFDLDYYEPEPRRRQEDSAFYGEERLVVEVLQALDRIGHSPPRERCGALRICSVTPLAVAGAVNGSWTSDTKPIMSMSKLCGFHL